MPRGNPGVPKTRRPIEDRFWEKVEKKPSGCWEWTGSRASRGYGRLSKDHTGDIIYAHRFSYEYHTGDTCGDRLVLHRCDNPPCVNPEHLYLGNHEANMRDMRMRNRVAKERNGNSKLTNKERAILRFLASNLVSRDLLAEAFGVHRVHLDAIIRSDA